MCGIVLLGVWSSSAARNPPTILLEYLPTNMEVDGMAAGKTIVLYKQGSVSESECHWEEDVPRNRTLSLY